jgi:hypothetical protein
METLQNQQSLSLENLVRLIHLDRAKEKSKSGKLGRVYYSEKTKREVLKLLRSSNDSAFHLDKILGIPVCTIYRWKSFRPAQLPKFRELTLRKDKEKSTTESPVSASKLIPIIAKKEETNSHFSEDSCRKAEIVLMFGLKLGVEFIAGNKFNIAYIKLGKS